MERIIAGYARVSTDHQVERDSLINQELLLREYAEKKHKPFRLYQDAGISAKNTDRPAFQRLIHDVEEGLVEAIVVTRLDRINRNIKDLLNLKELCDRTDTNFVCLGQDIDTTTPSGKFMFNTLGSVAEFEREITAERVAESMRMRAQRGMWNGGVVPFGYQYDEEQKKRVIVEEEARVVRYIYEMYLEKKSFRNVTHLLNSLGMKTRKGEFWSPGTIARILSSPTYYGALTYNKRKSAGKSSTRRPKEEHIIIEGIAPPIVSKEHFDEIQIIIESQKRIPPATKGSTYLLTGLVWCGACGSRMSGSGHSDKRRPGSRYSYYKCVANVSKGKAACKGNLITMQDLDDKVTREVKTLSLNPDRIREALNKVQNSDEVEIAPLLNQQDELVKKLRQLDDKFNKLFELYEEDLITKDEFGQRRATIDTERQQTEEALQEIRNTISENETIDIEAVVEGIQYIGDVYDDLTLPERKDLLQNLLNTVTLNTDDITMDIFLPVGIYNCTDHHAVTNTKHCTIKLVIPRNDYEYRTLGEYIRTRRKMKGWFKKELAERIGATEHSVIHWERDWKKPRLQRIRKKLVEVLELDPVEFERLMKESSTG